MNGNFKTFDIQKIDWQAFTNNINISIKDADEFADMLPNWERNWLHSDCRKPISYIDENGNRHGEYHVYYMVHEEGEDCGIGLFYDTLNALRKDFPDLGEKVERVKVSDMYGVYVKVIHRMKEINEFKDELL